ncbi:retrovirus-related pol polyprotein from transposon TNT 1-94 [Tanacetum coccineum]|uniref:Retrovirus-related pol polyprotein from transposon TNT 1-94 n=1 Tax=Tanacetum coccineum TaxID=301880 RepID=A0ABQ5BD04_9ASTR
MPRLTPQLVEFCTLQTFVVQKRVLKTRFLFLNPLEIVQDLQDTSESSDDNYSTDVNVSSRAIVGNQDPSLEVVEIVDPEVGRNNDDILLTIKDDILLSPSFPNFSGGGYTFDNLYSASENFPFNAIEEIVVAVHYSSSLLFPIFKAFYVDNDHFKEKSSGSTTTHVDFSQYDSFILDLSNDQFPPADRSDPYHEEFADELAHIMSLPNLECFKFKETDIQEKEQKESQKQTKPSTKWKRQSQTEAKVSQSQKANPDKVKSRPMQDKKPDLTFFCVFGAFCYPTNDSEDLGKLQPTADIGIFVGYAPIRKGYRIYNKRTRCIMETIHMQFDELTEQVAPVQLSTGPAPTYLTPRQISSGLVPNPVPAAPYVPPTNKELEILFQPMFDEYMEPPRVEIPVSPALAVSVPVNSAGTPSSTTIDQDAPSPSHSPSSSALQSPSLHTGIAADSTLMEDNPFAPVDNHPFINVFDLEPSSEASSSRDLSSADSPYVSQTLYHLGK